MNSRYFAAADVEKNLAVAVTSDKGLCGGINSAVSKLTRGTMKTFQGGTSDSFLLSLYSSEQYWLVQDHLAEMHCKFCPLKKNFTQCAPETARSFGLLGINSSQIIPQQ